MLCVLNFVTFTNLIFCHKSQAYNILCTHKNSSSAIKVKYYSTSIMVGMQSILLCEITLTSGQTYYKTLCV